MVRRAWWLVLTLAVVVGAQWMVAHSRIDVSVQAESLAGTPVLHFAAAGEARGAVVILHDFGGSKEMMQCWGYALARRGFEAYAPDLPGHGDQVAPLPDGPAVTSLGEVVSGLVDELIAGGRAEPGKVALVGRGLGAEVALATARRHPAVGAVVIAAPPPTEPGSTEMSPAVLTLAGNRLAVLSEEGEAAEATAWLHRTFGTEPPPGRTSPPTLPWLALSLGGGLGALIAASGLVRPRPPHSSARQRPTGLAAGLAAVSVSLLSAVLAVVYWRLPLLGVAVLDYLIPYFLVAAAVLLLLRILWPREFGVPLLQAGEGWPVAALRGLAVALAFLGAVVPVIHLNITHFVPNSPRLLPLAVTVLVLWLYAVQEEGLKRAVAGGPSLGGLALGVAAKLVMVATWVGAGVLPNPPVFLATVAPVTLAVLIALELIDWWLAAMRHSAVSIALVDAFILGWTMAVVFPLV